MHISNLDSGGAEAMTLGRGPASRFTDTARGRRGHLLKIPKGVPPHSRIPQFNSLISNRLEAESTLVGIVCLFVSAQRCMSRGAVLFV